MDNVCWEQVAKVVADYNFTLAKKIAGMHMWHRLLSLSEKSHKRYYWYALWIQYSTVIIMYNQIQLSTDAPHINFQGRKRRINIPQEAGVKSGARLNSIALKHMNDINEINIEIIEECVAGKSKHPVTSHLEDRHQSFMWHWTKHTSWREWRYQKLTKDLHIVLTSGTALVFYKVECCSNCYLSMLCKVYRYYCFVCTYMYRLGHPLHFPVFL